MDSPVPTRPTVRELVRAAVRIPFFLKVPASHVDASWMQILALVVLTVAVPTIYALIRIGVDGRFQSSSLPGALFHVPVMLVAATIISYLIDRGAHVRVVFAAALLALIPIDIIDFALWAASQQSIGGRSYASWGFYVAPLAWLSLAVARFSLGLAPTPVWKRLAVVVAGVAFLGLPLAGSMREQSLWTQDWSKKASAARRGERLSAATEESFYKQPELLQRQLDGLAPQRKGVIDVYLVAVAGYGSQDVFMREVESVAKLFRERFDADGRIVTLVNNPKTVMTYPVASETSLRAALERIGKVMDRDEDVLVLFLTSHGSEDHKVSLELWPLQLKPLTPPAVREAFEASGIRNRVIIVSACYAGGFVPPLQDDNTLVIAAAAADRNSFGCDNESDWTYFGKAYFDEALRHTTSFARAFEDAKPVIAEREREQKYDPSNPQMWEGNAIKAKLAALERQLEGAKPLARDDAPARPADSADKAERYVALIFPAEMAKSYLETCRQSMAMNGPDKTLERAPASMGGLDHSSPQWPRLVAAWDRYAEETCRRINDPDLYREIYLRQVRSSMSDADLDTALRLHGTHEGRRLHEAEKRLSILLAADLGKRQGEIQASLYKDFVTARDKLFAEAASDRPR